MLARRSVASGTSIRSTGVVAIVVTMAMTTIIVKSVGEITPRSSPTFSTINSISPRVFISTPRPVAVRHSWPARRADASVPPNLPMVATAIIAAHVSQLPESVLDDVVPHASFAAVYGYEWYVREGPPGAIDRLA